MLTCLRSGVDIHTSLRVVGHTLVLGAGGYCETVASTAGSVKNVLVSVRNTRKTGVRCAGTGYLGEGFFGCFVFRVAFVRQAFAVCRRFVFIRSHCCAPNLSFGGRAGANGHAFTVAFKKFTSKLAQHFMDKLNSVTHLLQCQSNIHPDNSWFSRTRWWHNYRTLSRSESSGL